MYASLRDSAHGPVDMMLSALLPPFMLECGVANTSLLDNQKLNMTVNNKQLLPMQQHCPCPLWTLDALFKIATCDSDILPGIIT